MMNKILTGMLAAIIGIGTIAPSFAAENDAQKIARLERQVRALQVERQKNNIQRVRTVNLFVDRQGVVRDRNTGLALRDANGRVVRQAQARRQLLRVENRSAVRRGVLGVAGNARDIFLDIAVIRELERGNVGRALIIDRLVR